MRNYDQLLLTLGCFCSLPIDYLLKATAKANFQASTIRTIPIVDAQSKYSRAIILRTLRLNAITSAYRPLWENVIDDCANEMRFTKRDERLQSYDTITHNWSKKNILVSDYARRQALLEIDVLVSMAFELTLDELMNMYRLQFHILRIQESNTWYDANGRITFTNNRSLTGVGFSRPEWENAGAVQPVRRSDAPWDGVMKHAPAGYVFARTIMDDTMPGGPVERTIEYVAPFDRCDREQDYETAWKFFEEKYGKE